MFQKNDWHPKILEFILNANYLERRELYQYIKNNTKEFDGNILDLGCGTKPYRDLFHCEKYIGLEINRGENNADYFYDGNNFPFKDEEFDNLVSFQAIYQADNIEQIMREINRVVKQNGKLLISVPFIWFDGGQHSERKFSDRYSFWLFEKYGFQIINIYKTNNNLSALFLLANSYLNSNSLSNVKFKPIRVLLKLLITPLLNFLGSICLKFGSKSKNLYIDSIIVAQKVKSV